MTIRETITYIENMKKTAQKDTDKRAARCVEAMDNVLSIINERRMLTNRCYVLSGGALCAFCPMECGHKETDDE